LNLQTIQYRGRLLVEDLVKPIRGYPIAIIQADPKDPNATPDDRKVRLVGDDWVIPLPHRSVDEVTLEEVKAAMRLPASQSMFLLPTRLLPDYHWLSVEMNEWLEAWRSELVIEYTKIELVKSS
jgi:hypothetical protein